MYRVILASVLLGVVLGAPVNPGAKAPDVKEGTDPMNDNFMSLEYKKYLEEVVQLLESDEDFKKELEKMETNGDNTGQIAHYLQFANQNTRTKLDELKRLEVRRLRDLHKKLRQEAADQIRSGKRPPGDLPNVDAAHVDHDNPHTFEIEDLKKLIKKTTDDLSNVDKKRKEEFKKYEMNKEHEYRQQLKNAADDEAREKLKKEHEEKIKRHKDHPKVHHPGNKAQLQEVWEEEDHLDPEEFDPKVFFGLHDIDGDGYLNTPEIEALFQKELDKVYNSSNSDDDMVERDEEMNRMREHVFGEIDADKDGLVSLDEFIKNTQSDDFDEDEPWKGLSEEDEYDSEEYDRYEKALEEQEEKLRQQHQQQGEHKQPEEHKEQPNVDTNEAGMQHNNENNQPPSPPEHQPAPVQPAESQHPGEGQQPVEGQQLVEGQQPVEGQHPAEGQQQVEGQHPAQGQQPAEADQPAANDPAAVGSQ